MGKDVGGENRLKSRQMMSMTAASSPRTGRKFINNNNTNSNEQTKQAFSYSRRDSHLSQRTESVLVQVAAGEALS